MIELGELSAVINVKFPKVDTAIDMPQTVARPPNMASRANADCSHSRPTSSWTMAITAMVTMVSCCSIEVGRSTIQFSARPALWASDSTPVTKPLR